MALLQWPRDQVPRAALLAGRSPRLLLLDQGDDPPELLDCLEDWIRVPAPEADVQNRMDALIRRATEHEVGVPEVDADGVARLAGASVVLPPLETRLARVLVERFGSVVSRDTLGRAGWPGGPRGRNALDVHMMRLRRRLAPLGLAIRTVRSRGYLLEARPSRERMGRR